MRMKNIKRIEKFMNVVLTRQCNVANLVDCGRCFLCLADYFAKNDDLTSAVIEVYPQMMLLQVAARF